MNETVIRNTYDTLFNVAVIIMINQCSIGEKYLFEVQCFEGPQVGYINRLDIWLRRFSPHDP